MSSNSRLFTHARVIPKITIELEEHKFRALLCIAQFGADTVIEKLSCLTGKVMSEHKDGLWQFFDQFHQFGGGIENAINRSRAEFHSGKSK